MATPSLIICNAENYVYCNNETGSKKQTARMYVGTSNASGTNPGNYRGYFCITEPDSLEFKENLYGIKSITLTITTGSSTSGYNSCYARIDYAGTTWDNNNSVAWRFGNDSNIIHLLEGEETTLTITDQQTLKNFSDMIRSSKQGENAWFRLLRVSGQGAVIKASCSFTIEYATNEEIAETEAPKLNGYSITDRAVGLDGHTGLFDHFGVVIQNESSPSIRFDYMLDARYWALVPYFTLEVYDPDNQICQLHSGDSSGKATVNYGYAGLINGVPSFSMHDTYDVSTAGLFHLKNLDKLGTYRFKAILSDKISESATLEGSFKVVPYHRPSINEFYAERYVVVTATDTDKPEYVAADDGSLVRFKIYAEASSILEAGENGYIVPNVVSVNISYGLEDEVSSSKNIFIESSKNGFFISLNPNDELSRQLLSQEFSAAYAWNFTLTISDFIGSQSRVVYIERASADFNVESYGTAVGMRSTGSNDKKLFEVAPEYESIFYGGIKGVNNFESGEVATGGKWIDGKQIYRTITSISVDKLNSRVDYVYTLPNVAFVINIYGCVTRHENGNAYYPLNFWYSTSNFHSIWLEHPDSLSVKTSHPISGYVIIEYTKIDDDKNE